jgi:hypothetical protein
VKPDKLGRALFSVVLTAIGAYTIAVNRRHLSPPLMTAMLAVVSPLAAIVVRVPMRKLLGVAAAVFVAYWTYSQPANAAHTAHNTGAFLAAASVGFAHFTASI